MGRIRIGLSSWTDKSLLESGKFYPPEISDAAGRLKYYTMQFPHLVEVNSTYYSPPAERNAILWVERTPDDFLFDLKMYSLFTQHPTAPRSLPKRVYEQLGEDVKSKPHIYLNHVPPDAAEEIMAGFVRALRPLHEGGKLGAIHAAEEIMAGFVSALRPLHEGGKLGAILLQVPRWFYPGQRSRDHISWCKERLADYPVAVEFRNGDWLAEGTQENTLDFLRSNGLAYVCVDEPQGHKSSVPPVAEVTSPILSYVRFHGRRKETWERPGVTVQERTRYLYSREELGEWVPKVEELAGGAAEVHVLMNTNYLDYAVRNARQLKQLLESET
ncbi:MAG: DUF72 domain-containing protein [Anaerolineae bacterium]